MKTICWLAVLIGVLSSGNSARAVLPSDLRRMPVSIEIPSVGTGSGVYLVHSNWIFLVSVKHVFATNILSFKGTNALLSSIAKDDTQSRVSVDLLTLANAGQIKAHKSHDIIAIRLGFVRPRSNSNLDIGFFQGVDLTGTPPVMWTTDTNCQPASKIFEGDEALIFGFPTDLFNPLAQQQIDFYQPLVRKGIISQKNRTTGKFILDTGVFGGNSGGPFLVSESTNYVSSSSNTLFTVTQTHHIIAGLMVQFVPAKTRVFEEIGVTNQIFVYSGYSVAEPIEAVLELLDEFK